MNIEILDPGHCYKLPSLDGDYVQKLRFVKRCDLERPWRYPGNIDRYPGATLQFVIRALLERVAYLQGQIWCPENAIIRQLLRLCLWLLEVRAARRHRRSYWHGLNFAATSAMCPHCGHTDCRCNEETDFYA